VTISPAVKADIGTPNLTGKHVCWWSKLYGNGICKIDILHQAGKHNCHADALSDQPTPTQEDSQLEVQVSSTGIPETIGELIENNP